MRFPVGRHDPCRRCKSVHTVTRRDEVITPYGSRPDTQGNNHNRPAAHCYARQITGAQSCGKKKKESADLQSTLSSFLAANATLSGAKESWGVARGDRKPWCPIPFCPSPREGRVPARRSVQIPPAAGRRQLPRPGRGASPHAAACETPCRRRRQLQSLRGQGFASGGAPPYRRRSAVSRR